ncbi:MAG: gephyrin-like molybdotransferase Glp [bacterium]
MKRSLKVITVEEVFSHYNSFPVINTEEIPLLEGYNRILAEDVTSTTNIPDFDRSIVDGYAVLAKDTDNASETNPLYFELIGEVLMGEKTDISLGNGLTARVATGGMLPINADAVVMTEYTQDIGNGKIEINRPISKLENVILMGEDIKNGETILKKGHCLRPPDLGALAAIGCSKLTVFKKLRVALISTGDEVIDVDQLPAPGQVRDINHYTIDASLKKIGAIPLFIGIIKDCLGDLCEAVEKAIEQADLVIISGSSSVGTRDYVIDVINSFPNHKILVHGISVRPGKPTIIGDINGKPIIGLPGHPASTMVIFNIFLIPLIRKISGYKTSPIDDIFYKAILTRSISAFPGRTEYIRVKIEQREGRLYAEPILGKSGLISTLVKAQGLLKIDMDTEGIEKGNIVDVIPFPL